MPIFNARELGSMGVVSDIAPWDLPPNVLSDGRNFRVSAGKVQASGGSKRENRSSASGTLGHIDQAIRFNGESQWVVCGNNGIYAYDGAGFSNVYATSDVDPDLWTTCKIGRVIFFNHPQVGPLYWRSDDEDIGSPQPLPFSPTQATWGDCKASGIVSHRNFLFVFNTTEIVNGQTQVLDDRLRWSHPISPNGIPYTWEPANDNDRSSLAGYVTLGRGGAIVGAESLRDSLVVYSAEAVNVLDYTGGPFQWNRRTVSQAAGLISTEAVTEVRGMHYFMAYDDILMFDGNQSQSLLHNRLRKKYASSIDVTNLKNSFSFHNKTFNEIWFCFPEKGETYPSVAFVHNYRDGTMAIRDLSLSKQFPHATYGKSPGSDETWDSVTMSWGSERTTWRLGGQEAFDGRSLAVSGGDIYNIDTVEPDEDITTFIERTHLPVAGHENTTTLTRLYPQIEGSSTVQMQVGSHQAAGDGVRWSKPCSFNPVADRKIDSRATGELMAIRLDGKASDNFNFTGFDAEYVTAGRR